MKKWYIIYWSMDFITPIPKLSIILSFSTMIFQNVLHEENHKMIDIFRIWFHIFNYKEHDKTFNPFKITIWNLYDVKSYKMLGMLSYLVYG